MGMARHCAYDIDGLGCDERGCALVHTINAATQERLKCAGHSRVRVCFVPHRVVVCACCGNAQPDATMVLKTWMALVGWTTNPLAETSPRLQRLFWDAGCTRTLVPTANCSLPRARAFVTNVAQQSESQPCKG